jgi:hypothetical protein
MTFTNEDIGQFQGNHTSGFTNKVQRFFSKVSDYIRPKDASYELYLEKAKQLTVDSRYRKLKYLEAKMKRTNTPEDNRHMLRN